MGDYGTIQQSTGEFQKEANIYDLDFAPELDITREKYPPDVGAVLDQKVVTSEGAIQIDFGSGISA